MLSWSDLPGLRVGLYGLGREGEASIRACRTRGIRPVLVDDVARPEGIDGTPVLTTSDGGLAALLDCDVVIKAPGVSRYGGPVQALMAKEIPVVGGLGLWLQEADLSRVACITGTKGKSTTTTIAGHLLSGLGYRPLVGGNIGLPPFDPGVGSDYDFWVIEVSSYQSMDLTVAPPVVAVTSLHPDHLPWHRGEQETYFRDKLSLCRRPGADLTVANGDSQLLRNRRDLLGPRVRWVHAGDDPETGWIEPLGLLGAHNRRNALIARAVLQSLRVPEADDVSALAQAAAGMPALESRLQIVGEVGEVTFVDDSLSTNVLPTLAAVDAFSTRRVALIVGGQDRGIDYRELAIGLRSRKNDLLVLAIPDNGPVIVKALQSADAGPMVATVECSDLTDAVLRGYSWAQPDGVVLMSPAAASFGQFRDYRERSSMFAAAMGACIKL